MAKGRTHYITQQFPSEERSGASVFYKDGGGNVFHTYSTYGRGLDMLIGAYNWLDMAPNGCDEEGLPHGIAWVRHHDKYADSQLVDPKSLLAARKAQEPAERLRAPGSGIPPQRRKARR